MHLDTQEAGDAVSPFLNFRRKAVNTLYQTLNHNSHEKIKTAYKSTQTAV